MRPPSRAAIIVGALVLAVMGCGTIAPTMPAIATTVGTSFEGSRTVFSVTPWPLDDTVAFLCQRKPGDEFSVANPRPSAAAGCFELDVSTARDELEATFDSAVIQPEVAPAFAASGPPWYLAVAGSRGAFSAATVLTVINSPIYSPPGPT